MNFNSWWKKCLSEKSNMGKLPGSEKLIVNWTQNKTSQLSLMLTGDVRARITADNNWRRRGSYGCNQFFVLFWFWNTQRTMMSWCLISPDNNKRIHDYEKINTLTWCKMQWQACSLHTQHQKKKTKQWQSVQQVRKLPNFLFVPLSCTSTISRSDELPWDFSHFTFPTLWAWLGVGDLARVPASANFTGWEIFGFTAGIKSSGLDWSCRGLVDLRSTFTFLVPLSTELLDDTRLSFDRSRPNWACESSNFFSASWSWLPFPMIQLAYQFSTKSTKKSNY